MRVLLVIIGLLSITTGIAQTGIGTTTPDASAKLDVSATNKGFLPPRVTLNSATDNTTIPNPAEGLLVYNKGSVGLQAGYYYWNGANWATIATATSAGNPWTLSGTTTYNTTGNVGIGTTSPTSYASNTLQVNGASSASIKITNLTTGVGNTDGMDLYQGLADSYLWNRNNGMMSFGTNNAERMRITSGGNIILNNGSSSGGSQTSTPLNLRFNNDFSNGYTDASLKLYLFNSGSTIQGFTSGPAYDLQYHSSGSVNGRHAFYVANNEIMRINSSNVLIGTTSGTGALEVWSDGSSRDILHLKTTYASTGSRFIGFINSSGSEIGSVIQNGGSTISFNTSSDYRLKEKIQNMTGALNRVMKLKPVTYTWKADGSTGEGFIAHELQAVVPLAVTGKKDAVDKEGKPVYQSIDQSKIVGLLTAAMQEQQATIEKLKIENKKLKKYQLNIESRLIKLEAKLNQNHN